MARWTPAVLILLCAGLAAAAVAQATHLRRIKRETDQMRSRIDRLESRQKESAAAARDAVEKIREQVAQAERPAAPPPPPVEAAAPAGMPATVTEADVLKIVDQKVEEKLKAQGGNQAAGGDRKMPLHDLSKELNLDPPLQARVAEIANTAKKDIFDLLKTPRPDGTNLADEILDTFLSGDQARVQQAFLRIFSEKVPGTETTYLIGAGKVQERAYQGLEQTMGPEAFVRFKHMNVHPENIETGYDPWGERLRERDPK